MKAQIGKTYLTEIPHEGKELTFEHPSFKGTFGEVYNKIKELGLKIPSSAETASLVYDAFQNLGGKYESEIKDILRNDWFWEFTGNLYLPKSNEDINNGVILDLNPTIENGRLVMNKNSLIKRLQDNDSNVKFVPFGYKIDSQTPLELSKNPYIIARYGEEGADKIAKVADNYKQNPSLWSFNSVNEEKTRVSALNETMFLTWGVSVGGNNFNVNIRGHAFGVKK
jgi:hypothetical protein